MVPQKIVSLFRQASAPPTLPLPQAPKLLDQVRDKVRLKHYSLRTEQVYIHWMRRLILFHHLAAVGNIAASTKIRPTAP